MLAMFGFGGGLALRAPLQRSGGDGGRAMAEPEQVIPAGAARAGAMSASASILGAVGTGRSALLLVITVGVLIALPAAASRQAF